MTSGYRHRTLNLGEVCELRAGSVFKPDFQGRAAGKYPFIKVSDMNLAGNEIWITTANHWIDESAREVLKAKPFPAGTTVFAKIGEAIKQNRLRLLSRETVIDNNMMGAIPNCTIVDPRYFYYALSQFDFSSIASGTALPYLTVSDLSKLELPIPTLGEQRDVAGVVSALDDKIELNRRLSETLEAMAQALFQSWFVDFDPVRAKASGEAPESICQRLGLTPELLALFPDRLVESELGEIPEGWATASTGQISEVGIGKTPPRKEPEWFSDDPRHYRWISIRDMGQSDAFARRSSETLTPAAIERFNIRRIPDYTVLLSFKLTIGRLAITDGEMTTNEAIAHFKLDMETPVTTEFLYFYLNRFDFDRLGSTSSIAEAINSRMIRELPVLVPPSDLINAFSSQAGGFLKSIKEIGRQTDSLIQVRDTLLPKLLSGQVAVPTVGDR